MHRIGNIQEDGSESSNEVFRHFSSTVKENLKSGANLVKMKGFKFCKSSHLHKEEQVQFTHRYSSTFFLSNFSIVKKNRQHY